MSEPRVDDPMASNRSFTGIPLRAFCANASAKRRPTRPFQKMYCSMVMDMWADSISCSMAG